MSKVILTGATGTAGSEVLLQLIQHPSVSQVSVLTRRPLPKELLDALPSSSKLNIIEMADFKVYPPEVMKQLEGHSAVIWALGTSSFLVTKEEYQTLTYDYAVAAAKAFAPLSPDFKFVFVSGGGTTTWSPSSGMRVKAHTELALASVLGASRSFFFRPAMITPVNRLPGLKLRASAEAWLDKLAPTVERWMPSSLVSTPVLASALIKTALEGKNTGTTGKVFENNAIREMGKGAFRVTGA